MIHGDCCELRHALARLNIQVLIAGLVLQVVLMPLIFHGKTASDTGSTSILAATYAFEAACFIVMSLLRSRRRERAVQLWISSKLANALRKEYEGVIQ